MGTISELIRIVIYSLLGLLNLAIVVIIIGSSSRWLAPFEGVSARVLDPLLGRFTCGKERTVSPQTRATDRVCAILFLLVVMEVFLVMLLHAVG